MPLDDADGRSDAQILRELVAGIDYATLTTHAGNGSLTARPLQLLQIDDQAALWFFTAAASAKAGEIRREPDVNLAFADPATKRFVTLTGRALVFVDRARIEQLWRASQTVFFPRGPADPELALLKIEPASARYWDGRESMLGMLVKFGRAVLRGEASDLGASGAIEFGDS